MLYLENVMDCPSCL